MKHLAHCVGHQIEAHYIDPRLVDRFNNRRLLEPTGGFPPAEADKPGMEDYERPRMPGS